MKFHFDSKELQRFERLVSKLLRPKEIPNVVLFSPENDGITMKISSNEVFLEYTIASAQIGNAFVIPWSSIKEIASKPQGDVEIEETPEIVTIYGMVKGVPRRLSFQQDKIPGWMAPSQPTEFAALPSHFMQAMVDASDFTDQESTRYSLGGVSLQGGVKSRIAATDGRRMLIQNGFDFPWGDDGVICPTSSIFKAKELRELGELKVGYECPWICFSAGRARFHLRIIEGKYPNVDRIIPNTTGHTKVEIHPEDRQFLIDRIESLPCSANDKLNYPIDIEIDDHIAVRGCDGAHGACTELRLCRSRYEGPRVETSMNRFYMKKALSIGMTQFEFCADEPGVARKENAIYVWMPLSEGETIIDKSNLQVLESTGNAYPYTAQTASPTVSAAPSVVTPPTPEPKVLDMQPEQPMTLETVALETSVVVAPTALPAELVAETPKPKSRSETKPKESAPKSRSELEEETDQLRMVLRDALNGVDALRRELKASKNRERELEKREQALAKQQQLFRNKLDAIGKL